MNEGFKNALIIGAGSGLSAALARALAREGIKVALASRSTDDLRPLAESIGATTHLCDASQRIDIEKLFSELDHASGAPDNWSENASARRSRARERRFAITPIGVEITPAENASAGSVPGVPRSALSSQLSR